MECPADCISQCGVFDSTAAGRRGPVSKERCVARYELELFTSDGTGAAILDGKEYPIKRGMLLIAKPGQLRFSRLPIRCHYIHMTTENVELSCFLNQLPDVCLLPDIRPLEMLFHEMVHLSEPNDFASVLSLQGVVSKILNTICQQSRNFAKGNAASGLENRSFVTAVEEYIHDHLSSTLSLNELSEHFNFSPSHFHRIFVAVFGKTPHDYVSFRRIESAKAALRGERCSISGLAEACGFSSHSYFSSQFKKYVGMTPMQYRKQMLTRLDGYLLDTQ